MHLRHISLIAAISVGGCRDYDRGRIESDLADSSDLDVEAEASADVGAEVEAVEVADVETVRDAEVPWEVAPVACGLQDDETYVGPCEIQLGPAWFSTLCDEGAGHCVAPEPDCANGWCFIPARSFRSGRTVDQVDLAYDAGITVIPRSFYIGQTETTLGDFVAVMGYEPSGTPSCGPTCPVAGASVFEAMEFANRLSVAAGLERCYVLEDCGIQSFAHPLHAEIVRESWMCERSTFAGPDCNGYRLPSREEWELAAGAGGTTCLPRGTPLPWAECTTEDPELLLHSVYCGNADGGYRPCVIQDETAVPPLCVGPVPVGTKLPNDFGLYDTLGNVAEFTQATTTTPDTFSDGLPLPEQLLVRTQPEFANVVTPDDWMVAMGAYHASRGAAMCASTAFSSRQHHNEMMLQVTGFRLVRTVSSP